MKNTLLIALVILLLISQKPKKETASTDVSDLVTPLKNVKTEFGEAIAKTVERIYRLETAHFKTNQWKKTFSAGMEKFADSFPYGWPELKQFVKEYPEYGSEKEYSYKPFTEAKTGKTKNYISFPSPEAGMMYLGYVMKKRNNVAGTWFSHNP